MGKNGYDNERSYQDELDDKFFKGRKPSEKAPFTSKDLAYALAHHARDFISEQLFVSLVYYATDSVEKTCQKCHISKPSFYRLYRQLRKRYRFLTSPSKPA